MISTERIKAEVADLRRRLDDDDQPEADAYVTAQAVLLLVELLADAVADAQEGDLARTTGDLSPEDLVIR